MTKIGANQKDALKYPFCVEPISFSQTIKPIFFSTLQINLWFLFLKVVSSSSKNTNKPPTVGSYIKCYVNNKYVFFFFLSFFFNFFRNGGNISTTSIFVGF